VRLGGAIPSATPAGAESQAAVEPEHFCHRYWKNPTARRRHDRACSRCCRPSASL